MNIELKAVSPKHKLIYIDGEKRGSLHKESHAGPNSLDGKSQRYVAWSGEFTHDGKRLTIGSTESVSSLVAKIERAISSHEARKGAVEEGVNPAQSVRPALAKAVAGLEAAKDIDGLKKLRGEFVVKQEGQRMRFSKNRSTKNGDNYLRTGRELSEIKAAIRRLEGQDIEEGLGDMIKGGIKNVADRVLYGLGSETARGRLDLDSATKHLVKDWKSYVGRHAAAGNKNIAKSPTIGDLMEFLQFQYGVEVTEDELSQISNAPLEDPKATADDKAREALGKLKATSPKEYEKLRGIVQRKPAKESVVVEADIRDRTFDPKMLFPKLANFLIQQGVITVSRKGGRTAGTVAQQTARMDGARVDHNKPKRDPTKPEKVEPEAEPETEEKPTEADINAATSSAMTDDGHFIDAKKFSDALVKANINEKIMTELTGVLAMDDGAILNRMRKNDGLRNGVLTLISAALGSIDKANLKVDVPPNVTASGNTVNLNLMKDAMKSANIDGAALDKIREAVKAGTLDDQLKQGGRTAKMATDLAQSIVGAIQPAAGASKRRT